MNKILLTTLMLLLATNVYATSLTIQLGVNGSSENCTLYTGDKNSNEEAFIYLRDAAGYSPAIFWFDISAIGAGATINSATFSIYVYEEYNTSVDIAAGYIEDPDDTGAWDDTTDKATWNEKASTSNVKWEDATTDIEDVLSAAGDTQDGSTDEAWIAFDMATEVQAWVDGDYPNAGFWVREVDASNLRARSNAYGTAANRPKLVIDYTAAAGGGVSTITVIEE